MNKFLRPTCLEQFVGKNDIKSQLKIYINSCLTRKVSLDHVLLWGLPGTGKTSLATIIANELGVKIHYVQGPMIKRPIDIINILSLIQENDILFIDEIHAIDKSIYELFYVLMEDFVIDMSIGREFNSKISRIKIPYFTLIGATTALGLLPTPFEDRFGITIFLDLYNENELFEIAKNYINNNKITIPEHAMRYICSCAKGTPRHLINLIKRYIDFYINNSDIDPKDFIKQIGYFEYGLNKIDLLYLTFLKDATNSYIGLSTLSKLLNLDPKTIESKIEPYLLQQKLIYKTHKGRKLSKKGEEIFKTISQ